ncbi:cold-shock protein [Pedobacter endophyticus]|uniref:Cold shock domain-containing protein n=1 Tax=Pedobacter endophyticus TaxID=2789740 RepID=A0A7S9L2G7_9SPHI|nr:cold shock domain-containing protein [Pedobacter endophyticus]QPH41266.1 cold shock domain-containing protein [Pedobacter endophyticus]
MRTGTIIAYNKKVGVGLIKDSNGQHIKFFETDSDSLPARGAAVTFDIGFRNRALAAINVFILKLDSESNPRFKARVSPSSLH